VSGESSSGTARIDAAFAAARREGRAALMPYVTAGYPHLDVLEPMLLAAGRAGADVIEVGVPFSDPLADGPVLQRAAEAALQSGYRLRDLFPVLARVMGSAPPLVLLTYVNPVLAYGVDRFLDAAAGAGVAGLIIPDLPVVESREMDDAARARGLGLIPLAAPTSTDRHLKAIASGPGFVYGVSVTGVTGAREQLAPEVTAFARRLKAHVQRPVAIGFGISTPEQARAVARAADGVIIGSALVRAIGEAPERAPAVVEEFVGRIRKAMDADLTGHAISDPVRS
jgi:tryptophan synthase alpha chain